MADPASDFDLISGAAQAASGLFAAEITDKTIVRLNLRCERATGDLSAAAQSLIDAASSSLAASKAAARSLQRHRSLWFDKHMEELDAGAKLLAAAARIPVGSGMEDAELAMSLEALLPLTSSSLSVYQSNYIGTPVEDLGDLRAVLEVVTRLQLGVSAVTSVLSGPGVRWFKSGLTADAASHNVIRLDARDVLGEALRSLSVEDVDVRVTGVGTSIISVSLAASSTIEISYNVSGSSSLLKELYIDIIVGGEAFPSICVKAGRSIEGIIGNMYPIAEAAQGQATRIGMALSPAEDVLAISNADKGAIEVYSFPAMSLLRILGSSGSRPGHFHTPYKLCFSQAGTLLVVEHENDRVQEVTLTGGHVRYIGERTIRSPCAISVSRAGDLVAVTWAGHVSLFQFDTGALLRSIASSDVTRTFYGVCFTPDDLHLAVTRFKGDSVVNFLNLDGETLWSSVRLDSPNGVAFATNGDLLVCQNQHRMAVLSPDGKEVMRAIDFGAGPKSKRLSDTIVRYPFSLVMRENGSVLLLSQFGTHVVEIA